VAIVAAAAVSAFLWLAGGALAGAPPTHWCGTPGTATDLPDTVNNVHQIHVIYAIPSDGTDRLAQLAEPIVSDLSAIDSWWQSQDPTRTLRFDLASFPGCDTSFGQVDISDVRLAHDSSYYASEGTRYDRLRLDLTPTFSDPNKKYLVYYDGPVDDTAFCGISVTGTPLGGADAYAEVYLASLCAQDLGTGGTAAIAAVHEVIHNLNALDPFSPGGGPPHRCPRDGGHPCDSPADILYPATTGGKMLSQEVLDVGHDDYYDLGGKPWFDVRNSLFLIHLDEAPKSPQVPHGTLTATSSADSVSINWGAASGTGNVYRVYRDGTFLGQTAEPKFTDKLTTGATASYTVQAEDALGNLGPAQTIRFTLGLGLVDGAGSLVRDTVPPSRVSGLGVGVRGDRLVLRWRQAVDLGGLRGYRILVNGKAVGPLVVQTTVALPVAAGRYAVVAVDRAGNIGPASSAVTVNAQRKKSS
jgi:hypothetical protein